MVQLSYCLLSRAKHIVDTISILIPTFLGPVNEPDVEPCYLPCAYTLSRLGIGALELMVLRWSLHCGVPLSSTSLTVKMPLLSGGSS